MIPASGSALLSALGAAWLPVLADAAVKGTVVLAVASVVSLLARRASAAARHLVWFLALVGLLGLPALSAALPGWQVLPDWFDLGMTSAVDAPEVSAPSAAAGPAVLLAAEGPLRAGGGVAGAPAVPPACGAEAAAHGLRAPGAADEDPRAAAADDSRQRPQYYLQMWIIPTWAAGAALSLAPAAVGLASLRRLRRTSRRVSDGPWAVLLGRLSAELGLKRRVVLLRSSRRSMPMAWGLLRPTLLVPDEAEGWSSECLRAVLLHELAHIKRWDCLTQLVARLACGLYWFNPLAWLALHRMVAEHERACDDVVLACGGRAPDYAEHLLKVASRMPAVRFSLGVGIALARPSRLEGRLLAILDGKRSRRAVTRAAALGSILALAALLMPLAVMRPMVQAEQAAADKTKDARTLDLRGRKATDADLAGLKELGDRDVLYVSGDGITDAGLKELQRLKGLRELHLWEGGFTDAGLAELRGIEGLEVLYLRAGKITPAGLKELRNVKRLRELHLESTNLSTDAGLKELAGLQGLEVLRAGGANVTDTGVKELRGLTNLRELSLRQARINDAGLAALGGLQRLEALDVGSTGVGDAGLKAIVALKALRSLNLMGTAITDSGLKELGGLPGLQELDLRWTKITDAGLRELKALRALRVLDLRCTHITDAGLKELKAIQTLEVVRFAGPGVTNAGLEELKAVKGLRELYLGSTSVTDEGLRALKALPALAVLFVNGARITDTGLKELQGVEGLRELSVPHTGVTDAGLRELRDLRGLEKLDLYHTGITDNGLEALKGLTALRALNLGSTVVTDAGLRALEGLKGLREVRLADAKVTEAGVARLRRALPEARITACGLGPGAISPAAPAPTKAEDNPEATSTSVAMAELGEVAGGARTLDLRGKIVTDADLRKPKDLEALGELYLSGNGITDAGLKELKDLKGLKTLGLVCCGKITDAGMKEVGVLAGLRELRLVNTTVTDAGLAELKGLDALHALYLSGPKVTDAGLKVLKDFKGLREICLLGITFTDAGLKELKNLKDLRALDLRSPGITDAGLRELKGFTGLQVLSLPDTSITDAGLKELKGLKALRQLNLWYTKVTDAGMRDVAEVKGLQMLDLTYTNVTDAGLKELEGLKGLGELHCVGAAVTEAGVERLRKALPEAKIIAGEGAGARPTLDPPAKSGGPDGGASPAAAAQAAPAPAAASDKPAPGLAAADEVLKQLTTIVELEERVLTGVQERFKTGHASAEDVGRQQVKVTDAKLRLAERKAELITQGKEPRGAGDQAPGTSAQAALQDEIRRLLEEAVAQEEKLLAQMRQRYEVGKATSEEVDRQQVRVTEAKVRLAERVKAAAQADRPAAPARPASGATAPAPAVPSAGHADGKTPARSDNVRPSGPAPAESGSALPADGGGTPAGRQVFPLKYREADPSEAVVSGNTFQRCLSGRPAEVKAAPAGLSGEAAYFSLAVGPRKVLALLDVALPPRLFVDVAGTGDLSAVQPLTATPWGPLQQFGPVDIPVSGNDMPAARVRFLCAADKDLAASKDLAVAPAGYMTGEVNLDGQPYRVALVDHSLSGRYDNVRREEGTPEPTRGETYLAVDLNQDGRLEPPGASASETLDLLPALHVKDAYYRVRAAPDGSSITLAKAEPEFGALDTGCADLSLVLVGEYGSCRLSGSGGKWQVPAGWHAATGATLTRSDAAGTLWSLHGVSSWGRLARFDVRAGQVLSLRTGPPLTVKVHPSGLQPNGMIHFALALVGQAGENYNAAPQRGGVPQPPRFRVLDEAGNALGSGVFNPGSGGTYSWCWWRVPEGFKGKYRVEVEGEWGPFEVKIANQEQWFSTD